MAIFEEVLWTVMAKVPARTLTSSAGGAQHFPEDDGQIQYVWASTEAEARKNSQLPGKKRSLVVERTTCQHANHFCRRVLRHMYAVAFVHGKPLCPECVSQVSMPIDNRVEQLEGQFATLDDRVADLERPERSE